MFLLSGCTNKSSLVNIHIKHKQYRIIWRTNCYPFLNWLAFSSLWIFGASRKNLLKQFVKNLWNTISEETFATSGLNHILHYFAGNSDLHNGVEFGWLYTLAETSRQPYTHMEYAEDNITIYKIQVLKLLERLRQP